MVRETDSREGTVRVGVMIEGQNGLNWERWSRVLEAAEEGAFDSVFRSDHFTNPRGPDKDSLALWPSLTYAAAHTTHLRFGPLVSPVTFRPPAITLKDAAAVHDLSGGRLVLGLGIGWQEREHHDWGIPFPDVDTRYGMLRDELAIVRRTFRNTGPVSYTGRYFQVHDAELLPRPVNGGPPVLVGGNGPRRTLPLAAEFADEWNAVFVSPDRFRALSARLDALLDEHGRSRQEVTRSAMVGTLFAANEQDLADRVAARGRTLEEIAEDGIVAGTPAMWIEQLRRYADAGVERIMLQWLDLDDIAGIETVGKEVLPAFR